MRDALGDHFVGDFDPIYVAAIAPVLGLGGGFADIQFQALVDVSEVADVPRVITSGFDAVEVAEPEFGWTGNHPFIELGAATHALRLFGGALPIVNTRGIRAEYNTVADRDSRPHRHENLPRRATLSVVNWRSNPELLPRGTHPECGPTSTKSYKEEVNQHSASELRLKGSRRTVDGNVYKGTCLGNERVENDVRPSGGLNG